MIITVFVKNGDSLLRKRHQVDDERLSEHLQETYNNGKDPGKTLVELAEIGSLAALHGVYPTKTAHALGRHNIKSP